MNAFSMILGAVIGGFFGGLAARSFGKWLSHVRSGRGSSPPPASSPPHAGEDARQLQLIRDDLWKVKDTVERVLEEVSPLAGRIERVAETLRRPEPPSGVVPPPPRAPQREPWVERGEPAATSAFDGEPQPVAAVAVTAPPPNAINVEARDDRLVASDSYPPEAWLEPRGPAAGQLWLNPAVSLNEYALRRLSTFFRWEPERPGARYETETPASVQWDEGRRVGTVVSRGTARPR